MVLVVDDYADAREMYTAWLRVSGDRVALAGTVTDALSLAVRHLPDAIVGDLIQRTGGRPPAVPA